MPSYDLQKSWKGDNDATIGYLPFNKWSNHAPQTAMNLPKIYLSTYLPFHTSKLLVFRIWSIVKWQQTIQSRPTKSIFPKLKIPNPKSKKQTRKRMESFTSSEDLRGYSAAQFIFVRHRCLMRRSQIGIYWWL